MTREHIIKTLSNQISLIVLAAVIILFSLLTPGFFSLSNLSNTLVQASSTGILAVGMTFVLLTAGVDLSVGAIMFIVNRSILKSDETK